MQPFWLFIFRRSHDANTQKSHLAYLRTSGERFGMLDTHVDQRLIRPPLTLFFAQFYLCNWFRFSFRSIKLSFSTFVEWDRDKKKWDFIHLSRIQHTHVMKPSLAAATSKKKTRRKTRTLEVKLMFYSSSRLIIREWIFFSSLSCNNYSTHLSLGACSSSLVTSTQHVFFSSLIFLPLLFLRLFRRSRKFNYAIKIFSSLLFFAATCVHMEILHEIFIRISFSRVSLRPVSIHKTLFFFELLLRFNSISEL